MKPDKQENSDERSLVLYNTNFFPFLNYLAFDYNITIGDRLKDDNTDYEKMNKVIYL